MSRFSKQTSYGHRIIEIGNGFYRISWTTDSYTAGSRLRHPKVTRKDTDEAGAKRFTKKHGIAMSIKKVEIINETI